MMRILYKKNVRSCYQRFLKAALLVIAAFLMSRCAVADITKTATYSIAIQSCYFCEDRPFCIISQPLGDVDGIHFSTINLSDGNVVSSSKYKGKGGPQRILHATESLVIAVDQWGRTVFWGTSIDNLEIFVKYEYYSVSSAAVDYKQRTMALGVSSLPNTFVGTPPSGEFENVCLFSPSGKSPQYNKGIKGGALILDMKAKKRDVSFSWIESTQHLCFNEISIKEWNPSGSDAPLPLPLGTYSANAEIVVNPSLTYCVIHEHSRVSNDSPIEQSRLWVVDLRGGLPFRDCVYVDTSKIIALTIHDRNPEIAFATDDGKLRILDVHSRKTTDTSSSGIKNCVSLKLLNGKQKIACASSSEGVSLFDFSY